MVMNCAHSCWEFNNHSKHVEKSPIIVKYETTFFVEFGTILSHTASLNTIFSLYDNRFLVNLVIVW